MKMKKLNALMINRNIALLKFLNLIGSLRNIHVFIIAYWYSSPPQNILWLLKASCLI